MAVTAEPINRNNCEICGISFNSEEERRTHERMEHPDNERKTEKEPDKRPEKVA